MPRVTILKDKYIESDAADFLNGKIREAKLSDKDIAALIGITPPAFCNRKQNGRFKFDYMELVKIIPKLNLSDEEIIKLMRGKLKA